MRYLLTLLFLTASLCAAPWSPATVDGFTPSLLKGLVAYWKLDEASGTMVDGHGPGYIEGPDTEWVEIQDTIE